MIVLNNELIQKTDSYIDDDKNHKLFPIWVNLSLIDLAMTNETTALAHKFVIYNKLSALLPDLRTLRIL